jgi:SAM-dependent methyltransferase
MASPECSAIPVEFARSDRGGGALWITLEIAVPIVVDPDLRVTLRNRDGQELLGFRLRDHVSPAWLPRGRFAARMPLAPALLDAVGTIEATPGWRAGNAPFWGESVVVGPQAVHAWDGAGEVAAAHLLERPGSAPIAGLSWNRTHEDWFHKHFEHAARTTVSYLLKDHPLLRGRILDVGCGDGITDLGIALYCEPEQLIGIDPFGGFARLAEVIAENHLPADAIPPCLSFATHDANALPFANDSFDVVLSWGSLEHIAGGYQQALREIRRVLRDGGLFFVHPGLYYASFGHHLGEFSAEPHFHLKHPQDEVKRIVFETPPRRIDRSGHVATPAEYWQWYQELNPITVDGFERELRALDFEPWRVALRTEPILEYTPELLHYPMQQLATAELYVSCWNRKGGRR